MREVRLRVPEKGIRYTFIVVDRRDTADRIASAVGSGESVTVHGSYAAGGPQIVTSLELHDLTFEAENPNQKLPHHLEWIGQVFEAKVAIVSRDRTASWHLAYGFVSPKTGIGIIDVLTVRV